MGTRRFMHGPWHFAGAGIIANDDDEEIGLSAVYDDEPNGKLIIAAPDLVEAAKAALELLEANKGSDIVWADLLRAALKKAGAL